MISITSTTEDGWIRTVHQPGHPAARDIPAHPVRLDTPSPREEAYLVQVTEVGRDRTPGEWRTTSARSVHLAGVHAAVASCGRKRPMPLRALAVHVMRDAPENRFPNGSPKVVHVLTVVVGNSPAPTEESEPTGLVAVRIPESHLHTPPPDQPEHLAHASVSPGKHP